MKFQFSGNLLRYVDFHREVEVQGTTVEEGISNVVEEYPKLNAIVRDSSGHIRQLHRFFIDGELLDQAKLDQRVEPNVTVTLLTPIAGG